MNTAATIFLFLIAYLLFLICAYRIFLSKQYGRYKRYAIDYERPYSWTRFFFRVQLDPDFPKKYGRISIFRLLFAALVALGSLVLLVVIML